MKKKRLVVKYWSSQKSMPSFPERYAHSKRRWEVDLMYKDQENIVQEVELIPDKKLHPYDLLQVIREHLNEIVPPDSIETGFRIYSVRKNL